MNIQLTKKVRAKNPNAIIEKIVTLMFILNSLKFFIFNFIVFLIYINPSIGERIFFNSSVEIWV